MVSELSASNRARFGLAVLSILALASSQATSQTSPSLPASTAAFTDSAAGGLAATKRVAISTVVVSFQASAAGTKAQGNGMFADKNSAQSVLALPDMDPALQESIAEYAYRQLKADLTAAGYDVVPEAEVTANASYQEILKLAGSPNHTKFANAIGDAMLVSPTQLKPYLPYSVEGSRFEQPVSYIGWLSKLGGKSVTPGGPSITSIGTIWKLPSLEVQMAKSLNAHVVKAYYVVTLGQASAARHRDRIATTESTGRESGRGSANAELGLMADQTRIAFRAPNGNDKWQKVSMTKPAPAKDGDVVVRLAQSLASDADLFSLTSSSRQGSLFNPGADFQFSFVATLTNPNIYKAEVQSMIASADRSMTALVKR
ncbi:hypothetical protein BH11PSE2_BH11PSE2_18260 [soil metagenome]